MKIVEQTFPGERRTDSGTVKRIVRQAVIDNGRFGKATECSILMDVSPDLPPTPNILDFRPRATRGYIAPYVIAEWEDRNSRHRREKNQATEAEVREAVGVFKAKGGIIRMIPDEVVLPSLLVGRWYGIYETISWREHYE